MKLSLTNPVVLHWMAMLLFFAAISVIPGTTVVYHRSVAANRLLYTRTIRRTDIRDSAQNAFYSLMAAAFDQENYILTGEIIYRESYAKNLDTWNDELGTLRLLSAHDRVSPLAETIDRAGTKAVNEMRGISSAYESDGREAALALVRKGGPFVYIEEARDGYRQIQELYGNESNLLNAERFQRRLLIATIGSAALAVVSCTALFFVTRRSATTAISSADFGSSGSASEQN